MAPVLHHSPPDLPVCDATCGKALTQIIDPKLLQPDTVMSQQPQPAFSLGDIKRDWNACTSE